MLSKLCSASVLTKLVRQEAHGFSKCQSDQILAMLPQDVQTIVRGYCLDLIDYAALLYRPVVVPCDKSEFRSIVLEGEDRHQLLRVLFQSYLDLLHSTIITGDGRCTLATAEKATRIWSGGSYSSAAQGRVLLAHHVTLYRDGLIIGQAENKEKFAWAPDPKLLIKLPELSLEVLWSLKIVLQELQALRVQQPFGDVIMSPEQLKYITPLPESLWENLQQYYYHRLPRQQVSELTKIWYRCVNAVVSNIVGIKITAGICALSLCAALIN